jgi:hypothetical protein
MTTVRSQAPMRPDYGPSAPPRTYSAHNLGSQPLSWARAQHALLAADEDEDARVVTSVPAAIRLDSAFTEGD